MLFVILASPLMRSCLVLTGSSVDAVQLAFTSGLLGSGKIFRMASPAGLSLFAGILLPGNGTPVRGSIGRGQPAATQDSGPLKSPNFSAAVGTREPSTVPRRSLRHSSE